MEPKYLPTINIQYKYEKDEPFNPSGINKQQIKNI